MNLYSRAVSAALAAACFLAASAGCRKNHPEALLVGYDTSRSVKSRRGVFLSMTAHLPALLDPATDSLTLYRVDCETQEFYDKAPPSSGEALQELLLTEIERPIRRDGTYPALFFREAARRAEIAGEPVIVIYCSDGDNDDMSAASDEAIRQAAQKLAANRLVRLVAMYAVSPCNRAALHARFDCLGGRLKILGPDDTDTADITRAIEEAHR